MGYGGVHYCAKCQAGMIAARGEVRRDVVPKDCFIVYHGNDVWRPIEGTRCAHWVAHQLDIHTGWHSDKCLLGYTYRVPRLIERCSTVSREDVRSGDIWYNNDKDHTGLVIKCSLASSAAAHRT